MTPSTTVAGAAYQQSFSYDHLNRLTSGPLGTYTYGDAAHLDAATAIGSSYSASYDASGNMLCRAPTSGSICTGASPTGQQLSYDTEGNLTGWQDAPSNPTSTASVLYDGEGDRVEQVTTSTAGGGGTTTTTRYLGGGLEEIATTGSTTQVTKYYPTGVGGVTALSVAVNGAAASYSYLAADGLGSVSEALSSSGGATAEQLYAPYGGVRYSSGAMPGSLGYTGQHSDGPGGLAYYGARYYDPVAGQFASADTVLAGGLNRYAYVGDNPETATDPTGEFRGPSGCAVNPAACASTIGEDTSPAATDPAPGGDLPAPEGPGWLAAAPWLALGLGDVALIVWTLNGGADQALAWDTSTVRDTGQNDTLAELHGGWANPYHASDVSDTLADLRGGHDPYPNPNLSPTTAPTPTSAPTSTPSAAPPTAPGGGGGGTPPGGRPPVVTPPPGEGCGCGDGGIPNPRGRTNIRVWRAVKLGELEDIKATGEFRTPPGIESKYFSTDMEGAIDYAHQAFARYPQEGPYWLVSARFPRDLLTPDMFVEVDRGIQALVVESDLLPEMQSIDICGFIE